MSIPICYFCPKFPSSKTENSNGRIIGKEKRGTNHKFDWEISLAIIAVNGAVTRRLGLDSSESHCLSRRRSLERRVIATAEPRSRRPIPSAHVLARSELKRRIVPNEYSPIGLSIVFVLPFFCEWWWFKRFLVGTVGTSTCVFNALSILKPVFNPFSF